MKQMMQDLKKIYIPPFLKVYYERIALEKIVFNVPLFVRISDPESWLINEYYQKYKDCDDAFLSCRIMNLLKYTTLQVDASVFDGAYVLTLNDSLPYVEWNLENNLYASTDLLGKPTVFIDTSEFENSMVLTIFLENLLSKLQKEVNFVIFANENFDVYHNDFQEKVYIIYQSKMCYGSEAYKVKLKHRGTLSLFSFGNRCHFWTDSQGKLKNYFVKQESSVVIDEIIGKAS